MPLTIKPFYFQDEPDVKFYYYHNEEEHVAVRFDFMMTYVRGEERPDLIPLLTFDPVARDIELKILHKNFIHMVPLGMRSHPHKYLVLQEFSGSYWFHLSFYFPEVPQSILDEDVIFDTPRTLFEGLFANQDSMLFVLAHILEFVGIFGSDSAFAGESTEADKLLTGTTLQFIHRLVSKY